MLVINNFNGHLTIAILTSPKGDVPRGPSPVDLRREGAAHQSGAPDDAAQEDQLRPWQAIRQKAAG